jgi:hypothetical protein
MIKGSDAVNPAGRQFQLPGYEGQHVQFQKAKQLLGRVEHLNKGMLLVLLAL